MELNFKGPNSSSEKQTKFCRCLFTSSIKREIRHFHVVVEQKREWKVQKVWCTCEVVVLLIKPIVFMTFSLSSPSLDLKVPNAESTSAIPMFSSPESALEVVRRNHDSFLLPITSQQDKTICFLFLCRWLSTSQVSLNGRWLLFVRSRVFESFNWNKHALPSQMYYGE